MISPNTGETARRDEVAILRLEQLYPLRRAVLEAALAPYAEGTPVFWVQEEPGNMGAWIYMRAQFGEKLFGRWPFAGITRAALRLPCRRLPSAAQTGAGGTHRTRLCVSLCLSN